MMSCASGATSRRSEFALRSKHHRSQPMSIKRENLPWRELPHLRIEECAELSGLSRRTSRKLGRIPIVPTRDFRIWIGEITDADDPHADGSAGPAIEAKADRLIRKVG